MEELVNEVCNADVINVQHLQVKIQLIALSYKIYNYKKIVQWGSKIQQ